MLCMLTCQVAIQDLWCVAAKDMLLEYIRKMDLPNRYSMCIPKVHMAMYRVEVEIR